MSAEFDKFNPSVPNVSPGDYDVTRPISQPQKDKGLGTLFAGLGKGLDEAGKIVTDATKLQDFTNKQDIENRSLLAANAERESYSSMYGQLNVGTGALSPADEKPPDALKQLPSTAAKLKAGLDMDANNVYYKTRLDNIAKQYRAAYPQYADYIDQVFKKAGFGNTANELLEAQQKLYMKTQAALGAKDTETTALLKEGIDKGYPGVAELAIQHRAGKDVYNDVVQAIAASAVPAHKLAVARSELDFTKTFGESRKDAVTKYTTDNQQGVLSEQMNLKGSPMALGSVVDRLNGNMRDPTNINPDQINQDVSLLTNHIDNLREQFRVAGNTPRDVTDPLTGKTTKMTDRQIMGGTEYDASIENTLGHLTKIRDAMINHDYGAATYDARIVQGWKNENSRFLFAQPNLRGNLLLSEFISKNFPESAREIMQGILKDVSTANMPADLAAAANSHAIAFFNNSPEAAKKAVETLAKYRDNPAANQYILDQSQSVLNKKIAPELRNNAVEAFFGPKNAGITDGMSTNKAATYFATVTDPKYVDAIHELGPKAVEMHKKWVDEEVWRLFNRDFQELPEMEKGFKVHYNPDTHQFGLDYGKNKNINRWPRDAVEKLFAPSSASDILASGSAARVAAYTKTLDSVNMAAGGLANIALASKTDPNAYIIKTMQGTGNNQNDFWRSVKGQAEQYKVQPTEDQPNLKTQGVP